MHNLNVENYDLFEDITTAWKTACQITLMTCFEEIKEKPGYIKVFVFVFVFFFCWKTKQKIKKNVVKHQRLLLITKHRHLKLVILALLYVWEDVRVRMCA